jgi:parallel beta-helix repeat protein
MKAQRLGLLLVASLLVALDSPAARASSCLSISVDTSPLVAGTALNFSARCCTAAVPALPVGGAWLLYGTLLALGLLYLGRVGRRKAGLFLIGIAALVARPVGAQSCGGTFQWDAQSAFEHFTGTGSSFSFKPLLPGTFIVALSDAAETATATVPVLSGPLGSTIGSLELYGTFQSMGVIATLPANTDANKNAMAYVEYRVSGTSSYQQGFLLARVSPTRFVGSLFSLTPGTSYDVRFRYGDADGSPDVAWSAATASTRQEISIPAPLRVLQVAPTGSGTVCSPATPCSLTQAISTAQPGDEVQLSAGTYREGEITLPRSGTAGAPIVIHGQPGAIMDGAAPGPFTWTAEAGGVFRTTIPRDEPHLVTANGQRLYPYSDIPSLTALATDNLPGMFASGTTLHVHLAGGANPGGAAMAISRFNFAFFVGQSFIVVRDLTFQNYGQGSAARAIYLRDGSDDVVQGCKFVSNDVGVALKGAANRNVIQDNELSDSIFNWRFEDMMNAQLDDGQVAFIPPVDGRGNVVRRNVFHDDAAGISACPDGPTLVSSEVDLYLNSGYNLSNTAFDLRGKCSNVRSWSNTFHDVLSGITVGNEQGGPLYFLRNQIYRTGAGRSIAQFAGDSFKFVAAGNTLGPIYLLHNTTDVQHPDTSALTLGTATWQLLYARNNAWGGTRYVIEQPGVMPQVSDFDDDLLYTTSGTGTFVKWTNVRYSTIAAFRGAGQEAHGIQADPLFVNAAAGDLTPTATSPMVDTGIYVPGITDAFTGTRPDIGAVERP